MALLHKSIIYLLAVIISVPISKRLGFGSVLGYLCAGILIGPFGFGFVHEAEHFGDAARPDVLRAAGAAHAKILVIATAEMETSLLIAETAKRQFPNLTIIARAHNRRHAHKLMDVGIDQIFRDTLLSSLAMAESVLGKLGMGESEVRQVSDMFREADEKLLLEQFALRDSEDKLIQSAKDAARELESILERDPEGQG